MKFLVVVFENWRAEKGGGRSGYFEPSLLPCDFDSKEGASGFASGYAEARESIGFIWPEEDEALVELHEEGSLFDDLADVRAQLRAKLVEMGRRDAPVPCVDELCVERMWHELNRFGEEADPEPAEPVVVVAQHEHGAAVWCRRCGRVAVMSGAYYTHFSVHKPRLEDWEINRDDWAPDDWETEGYDPVAALAAMRDEERTTSTYSEANDDDDERGGHFNPGPLPGGM